MAFPHLGKKSQLGGRSPASPRLRVYTHIEKCCIYASYLNIYIDIDINTHNFNKDDDDDAAADDDDDTYSVLCAAHVQPEGLGALALSITHAREVFLGVELRLHTHRLYLETPIWFFFG